MSNSYFDLYNLRQVSEWDILFNDALDIDVDLKHVWNVCRFYEEEEVIKSKLNEVLIRDINHKKSRLSQIGYVIQLTEDISYPY